MVLYQDFRDDVMERLQEEPESTFAGIGRTRAEVMADEGTVDSLWARFQKNIEEYRLDSDDAWEDTLSEVLGVAPPSREQQKLKDALGKVDTKGVFNCTNAAQLTALAVIFDSTLVDEMSLAEWDKWSALADRIVSATQKEDEPRFSLYDYLDAIAHPTEEALVDTMLRLAAEDEPAFFARLVKLAEHKREVYSL